MRERARINVYEKPSVSVRFVLKESEIIRTSDWYEQTADDIFVKDSLPQAKILTEEAMKSKENTLIAVTAACSVAVGGALKLNVTPTKRKVKFLRSVRAQA
ncbi:MAG: hypothetical protein ACLTKZ_01260 [Lachnospiraceae bacterium]